MGRDSDSSMTPYDTGGTGAHDTGAGASSTVFTTGEQTYGDDDAGGSDTSEQVYGDDTEGRILTGGPIHGEAGDDADDDDQEHEDAGR